MSEFFDSHTHLEWFHRKGQLPEILQRAREAGLQGLVTVGTDPGDWGLYRQLAAENPGFVYYSAGLHPCHVEEDWEEAMATLKTYFSGSDNLPVALGETGLDRFHLPKDEARAEQVWSRQKGSFAEHLQLAAEWGCPLIIHSRGAFADCLEMVKAADLSPEKVVFHCFSEGPGEMQLLKEWGGRASFTGIITYKSAESVREAAACQGWDRILLETDAPYLAPVPHRGKTNEPSWVRFVAEGTAAYSGRSVAEIGEISVREARQFYGIA